MVLARITMPKWVWTAALTGEAGLRADLER